MDATKEHGKKKVPVIAVDEKELRAHVSEVVLETSPSQSVEETLNGLLEAEAELFARPGVMHVMPSGSDGWYSWSPETRQHGKTESRQQGVIHEQADQLSGVVWKGKAPPVYESSGPAAATGTARYLSRMA